MLFRAVITVLLLTLLPVVSEARKDTQVKSHIRKSGTPVQSHKMDAVKGGVTPSQLFIPSVKLKADENSPNPAIPAVRLVLDYFEQSMNAYKQSHQAELDSRVKALVEG